MCSSRFPAFIRASAAAGVLNCPAVMHCSRFTIAFHCFSVVLMAQVWTVNCTEKVKVTKD